MNNKPKKTFARELASALLLSLVYLAHEGDVEVVEVLVWPFISFAILAFGFKADVVKSAIEGRNTINVPK